MKRTGVWMRIILPGHMEGDDMQTAAPTAATTAHVAHTTSPNLAELQARLQHLEDLAIKAKAAADAYAEAVKAAAEAAGLDSAVVRSFVRARISERGPERVIERTRQLQMLFDEIED